MVYGVYEKLPLYDSIDEKTILTPLYQSLASAEKKLAELTERCNRLKNLKLQYENSRVRYRTDNPYDSSQNWEDWWNDFAVDYWQKLNISQEDIDAVLEGNFATYSIEEFEVVD